MIQSAARLQSPLNWLEAVLNGNDVMAHVQSRAEDSSPRAELLEQLYPRRDSALLGQAIASLNDSLLCKSPAVPCLIIACGHKPQHIKVWLPGSICTSRP